MKKTLLISIVVLLAFSFYLQAAEKGIARAKVESSADSGSRIALVIGNASYASAPLRNPVNDVRAIASALKKVGFQVTKVENASLRSMDDAVRRFGQKARKSDVALIYYSGHGLQLKGSNYLQPIGADIRREYDIRFKAYNSDQILAELEDGSQRVNIVILDACRNNPLSRSFRSASKGLAQPSFQPVGTIIAFSTAPGSIAYDGKGENSPYTSELYNAILEPGLKIEDVFKRVRVGVMAKTQSMSSPQIPWENSSLVGDFYFSGGPSLASNQNAAPTQTKPSEGNFSLADLQKQAETEKAWQNYFNKMESAYNEVVVYEGQNIGPKLKAGAWELFSEAFKQDVPGTKEDDLMRQTASTKQMKWINSQQSLEAEEKRVAEAIRREKAEKKKQEKLAALSNRQESESESSEVFNKGYFTVGSTKDEVLAVQGQPDQVYDDTWAYGSSHINFSNDKVESWYNSKSNPLKTKDSDSELSKLENKDFFTIGSKTNEVHDIQGSPDKKSGNIWFYGLSHVIFKSYEVSGWSNSDSNPLKAKVVLSGGSPNGKGYFTIGSTKDLVLAVQGQPNKVLDNIWIYGLSNIVFESGKVKGWSNTKSNPLKTKLKPSQKFDNKGYFTVGSTKDEVLAIQGQPNDFSDNSWYYGSSLVRFGGNKVKSWNDGSNKLKAKIIPSRKYNNKGYFTVGSTKDEVLAIQGQPNDFSDNSWYYGSSLVRFGGNKVKSWNDGSNKLKAKIIPSRKYNNKGYFTVGSTKDEVLAIQGQPNDFSDNSWYYGSSLVRFGGNKVKSWNDGSNKLKAKIIPSRKYNNKGYFTVGSTKDEVLAIQGQPNDFSDNSWYYGSSLVRFGGNKVKSWNDGSNKLKAKIIPSRKYNNKGYFTVGSTKDEVLAIQGQPNDFSDNSWYYGSSLVRFGGNKVKSWNDGSNKLKAKIK